MMENSKETIHIENFIPEAETPKKKRRLRYYAFIFDTYVIVALNVFITYAWIKFVNTYIANLTLIDGGIGSKVNRDIYLLCLSFTVVGYFFFSLFLNKGQTLGKMIFKLKVCAAGDIHRELTVMEALSRSIGYLFCNMLYFLPFIINFMNKESKGVADYISLTQVLTEKEMAALAVQEVSEKSTAQLYLFPEDPIAFRIDKAS